MENNTKVAAPSIETYMVTYKAGDRECLGMGVLNDNGDLEYYISFGGEEKHTMIIRKCNIINKFKFRSN